MLWLWIMLGLAGLLIYWMAMEAGKVKINVEELWLARLPESFDGTRLFFITDIHRRTIPDSLIQLSQDEGGADLVLIGGDLTEKKVPLSRTRANMRKLVEIAPVYAVYGNHDYDDDHRQLDVLLGEEGIRVLVNESVMLEQSDGSSLRLAGVDDPITERARVREALQDNQEAGCTILLAHDPVLASRLGNADIDLVLSGHTHGGQIALPFLGPVLRSPTILKYCKGWFKMPDRKSAGMPPIRLFVSNGFGTSKLPLRLMAPAQTHLFILRKGDKP
ncbi:metallophosphoesterase [Paenibacillaceae bacterium]|nr:metallophosphoesterase [Paenibacillaceae bacterium]